MALSLPEAYEGAHMGHADLRVRDKIFASLPNDESVAAVKISPASLDALVREDPETFRNAWGGRWVGVRLDRVSRSVMRALLQDAWAMTAPKSLAAPNGSAVPTRRKPPSASDAPRSGAKRSPSERKGRWSSA